MTGVRATWDETWLGVARQVAFRSLCVRDRVGSVVVDTHNRVVATGYNGPPAGFAPDIIGGDVTCASWCPRAKPAGHWELPADADFPSTRFLLEEGRLFELVGSTESKVLIEDQHAFFASRGGVYVEDVSPCYDDCFTIHAEANALLVCDRTAREGGTLYVSSHVCFQCAKLVANSGVRRVVVRHSGDAAHRSPARSYEFLRGCLDDNAVTVYDDRMRVLTYDTLEVQEVPA